MVMSSVQLEIKDHCADESQQQFSSQSASRRFLAFRERSVHPWRFNVNLDPVSCGPGGTADIYLPMIYEGIMVDSEFEVLRTVIMKSTAFWFVAPCSSERPRRFGGAAFRLLQLVFLIGLVFYPENRDNTLYCRENLKSNVILQFCVFPFLIL
jgi:hypothetical protein